MPRPHPPEFRQRAVELARLREKPTARVAEDLGISDSCLRNWMAQADIDDGRRPGLTSDERVELVKLRREKRVLELENEILKRAALDSTGQCNTVQIMEVCGGQDGSTGDVGREACRRSRNCGWARSRNCTRGSGRVLVAGGSLLVT
jgi:transposase-like protein